MENSEEVDLVRVCWAFCSLLLRHLSLETNLHTVTRDSGGVCWRVTSDCFLCLQMLLQNNFTAYVFSTQLSGTQWSVQDISSFLTKHSEDTRPPGTAFTWRNVFNETDQAIMSISRFMEVSLITCTVHSSQTFTCIFLFHKHIYAFKLLANVQTTWTCEVWNMKKWK